MDAIETKLTEFARKEFENDLIFVARIFQTYWVMRQRSIDEPGRSRPLRAIGNVGFPQKYLKTAISEYAAECE